MSNTRRPRRRPDDQVVDFNLDALQASGNLRPFVVQHGGRRWELAHMDTLDAWKLLAAADGGDVAAMLSIFGLALGDQWQAFQAKPMPRHKLSVLFDAYRKHCGVQAGESPASTDS
ncbi:hypothetical protein GCM10009639_53960 [Kitasatospora putterlickiae]|uniref:Uncharacterized protein n=1 Tax=Kitasatospora putterlickiae TaxID=221725 RepID=A0ABN1YDQ3_9ACTN